MAVPCVPNSNSFKAIPLSIYQCSIYEIWIFVGSVSETLCALANAWQHGNPRQPAPHPYLGKSQKVLISLLLCFLTKKSKVVKCAFLYVKRHILKVKQHGLTKRRRMPAERKRHILNSQQCIITLHMCI